MLASMARPVSPLELTPEEKLHLQRVARSKTGSQRDGLRARIVLRRAGGLRERDVAAALGVSLTTVSTWSRRFELQGLDGLKDTPGRGRKSWLAADKVRQNRDDCRQDADAESQHEQQDGFHADKEGQRPRGKARRANRLTAGRSGRCPASFAAEAGRLRLHE